MFSDVLLQTDAYEVPTSLTLFWDFLVFCLFLFILLSKYSLNLLFFFWYRKWYVSKFTGFAT